MKQAIEMQAYVCSDAQGYYGKESPVSLNEELFQLIVCQNDVEKEEQVRAAYPQLIERIRKYGVNYQIAMMNYAEYLFGIRDYRLAESSIRNWWRTLRRRILVPNGPISC